MPNWVSNNVCVHGDEKAIREFKNFIASGEQPFDFNQLLPMPKALEAATAHGDNPELIEALKRDWNLAPDDRFSKEDIDHARESLSNLLHYGASNWYDWCCSHWGTKWNACESYLEDETQTSLSYSFSTAWAEPRPVFDELLKRFPRLRFQIEYHEETECEPIGDPDDDDCAWRELWHSLESDALSDADIEAGVERQWYESESWID